MKLKQKTELNTIRLVYTSAGVYVEFWRYYDRANLTQPRNTYLIEKFDIATNLVGRLYKKYGKPMRTSVHSSGNIYVAFLVYDKCAS